jgi:hypothetical protein
VDNSAREGEERPGPRGAPRGSPSKSSMGCRKSGTNLGSYSPRTSAGR